MSDAFTTAYTALAARMKVIDVISNNLANAQTTGFKRDFGSILSSEEGFDVATTADLSVGDLVATGNDLDVAVAGEGFFAVETPQGVRYTRSGTFTVNDQGDLVTKDGMKVLATNGSPISVGEGSVSFGDDGGVLVNGAEVATLKVVSFKNPGKLEKEGLQRFNWTGASEDVTAVPEIHVKGGHLEHSNVNAVDEMVHLMGAYRDFESVQRTVKVLMTDMNTHLIQELGNLT